LTKTELERMQGMLAEMLEARKLELRSKLAILSEKERLIKEAKAEYKKAEDVVREVNADIATVRDALDRIKKRQKEGHRAAFKEVKKKEPEEEEVIRYGRFNLMPAVVQEVFKLAKKDAIVSTDLIPLVQKYHKNLKKNSARTYAYQYLNYMAETNRLERTDNSAFIAHLVRYERDENGNPLKPDAPASEKLKAEKRR